MLTNVYYYNIYRPYLIGTRDGGVLAPRKPFIAERKDSAEPLRQSFVLNKSLKDEIVSYAKNVSNGVTNLQTSSRTAARDMEGFNRRVFRDGFDSAREWLAEDIEDFKDSYNAASEFMQNQGTSPGLRIFSYEVADNLYYNRERLGLLGLSIFESGAVNFDRARFDGLPQEKINVAIGENIGIFSGLQRQAGEFLTEPLAVHMRFKGLGYHYNYKLGKLELDGFDAIEAGLLVDKAV